MKKFQGLVICSDLDGTLLKADKSISKENIEAIEYFKREGGTFTVMTGRMPFALSRVLDKISPSCPVGCGNGLAIFDTVKKSILYRVEIDPSALDIIDWVVERYPDIGVEITAFDRILCVKTNREVLIHLKDENLEHIEIDKKDFKEPFGKVLFAALPTRLEELIKELEITPWANKFQLLRSDHNYYEVLPKNTGKGALLKKLSEIMGFDLKNTWAIGDNDNDVSMMKTASHGVAVSTASPLALSQAEKITVSNEEHAIAKLIFDIEASL